MRNWLNWNGLIAAAAACAGLLIASCGSAPELTQTNALALLQANYDYAPGQPLTIMLGKRGLVDGIYAKYWAAPKVYPNRFWADYVLTEEGAKLFKVEGKGNVIEWRPNSLVESDGYRMAITTAFPVRLKAKEPRPLQRESSRSRSMIFMEAANFTGVPDGVQKLARERGNRLAFKRTAIFSYADGAWRVQSVQ